MSSVNAFSLLDLQYTHDDLQENERNWPLNLPDPKTLYARFYSKIHDLLYNIVCASCACIGHNMSDYTLLSILDQRLSCLTVDPAFVSFDFSCGVSALDTQNIMVDPLGIQPKGSPSSLWLCNTCHSSIMLGKRPLESLANSRWVGSVPDELKDLTWIEELLVARAHVVGRVVRLQDHNQASYFGIKGHIILLPQDTTLLLNLLPMSPASLPDVVRVVWTGKSARDRDRLRSQGNCLQCPAMAVSAQRGLSTGNHQPRRIHEMATSVHRNQPSRLNSPNERFHS